MRKEQQYNSSKQPGCDVNTRHGWYGGGVRISHRCIQRTGKTLLF